MRVLIDECLDERLRNFLPGHDCQTVRYAGLAGVQNGALLTAAERAGFDVLLTADQGITYEQNLRTRIIAIVVLRAKSNRLKEMLPLIPATLERLASIQPGHTVHVG